MRKPKLIMLAAFIYSPVSIANNFEGTLVEVLSPSELLLEVEEGVIELNLIGPQYPEEEGCNGNETSKQSCGILESLLSGKKLGIVIEQVSHPEMYGDITFDGSLLSLHLVREGVYRVDENYERSAALLYAENEARCYYKGIWRHMKGMVEVANSCMSW